MNEPLALETEHLSLQRPCWGNMEGALLPGTLGFFYFDIHIWVPFLDPDDVANLRCGTEEETSVHVLCECEDLASIRHAYLGSLFFGPWGCYESKYGDHLEMW